MLAKFQNSTQVFSLSLDGQGKTFKGKDQSMGLGWRINQYGKYVCYLHSGGTGGFRSFIGFDPDRQIGIVILSNTAEDVTTIGELFLKF